MEDLLPYYERELAFLRTQSRDFAELYPKVASQLSLSGDGCDDPHVERMIESFALLSARVNKKLDDSYPEFTQSLLNVLYPHYLRPFPSCSIANFELPLGADAFLRVPASTLLISKPIRQAICKFTTAWDVNVVPLTITNLRFDSVLALPSSVVVAKESNAMLSISFDMPDDVPAAQIAQIINKPLRLYIDSEYSVAAALRDALFLKITNAFVETAEGRWLPLSENIVSPVGFLDDESLFPIPENSHGAYRLLTEFFCFPEKFNFFDLHLEKLPQTCCDSRGFTVHLVFKDIRPESDLSRLLQTLSSLNLRMGCVPVVNLFPQRGDPIHVSQKRESYPLVADGRRAYAYEVYSVESVHRVRVTPQGEEITQFRPFFSLRHGESADANGHYWHLSRDDAVAMRSPGYEASISIVDADFDPINPKTDVLSTKLMCTNRDLPNQMSVGQPSGDLFLEGGSVKGVIKLLRKPTLPCRFEHKREGLWRLISHLSLNVLSLSGNGVHALQEMLSLYDIAGSAGARRQIAGIKSVSQSPCNIWLRGKPFACFVRGLRIEIRVDESAFVGTGMDVFTRCLDRFFSMYVSLNSFTQLIVLAADSGKELVRCEPRNGESILV